MQREWQGNCQHPPPPRSSEQLGQYFNEGKALGSPQGSHTRCFPPSAYVLQLLGRNQEGMPQTFTGTLLKEATMTFQIHGSRQTSATLCCTLLPSTSALPTRTTQPEIRP